ncbi:MAG: AAA family ATPase [Acidobacteriota bacterium]|nr:AAA family ATPase [Acidobacteriota bacterium]
MIHLRSVSIKSGARKIDSFPFNLPLVKKFKEISFRSPVVFLVGENGSGKSTLLEAMAAGVGSVTVGGDDLPRDATLQHAKRLSEQLKFVWTRKTRRGFFLRAEDFFNFAKRVNKMSAELEEMATEYEEKLSGYALQLARGVVLGQRYALSEKYGEDADARSHGESFLNLFKERFVPGGLYLLDEPEAPLSPQRQLAFLSMLKEMVGQDAQFVIATHSPILMAFPGASILNFDTYPVREVAYDNIEGSGANTEGCR